MKTSIKELRSQTKKIFSAVKQGQVIDIYYHNKCIAKIVPVIGANSSEPFEDYGFGMWADYLETSNISDYSRKLRKGRKVNIDPLSE